jgi:endoglucanase
LPRGETAEALVSLILANILTLQKPEKQRHLPRRVRFRTSGHEQRENLLKRLHLFFVLFLMRYSTAKRDLCALSLVIVFSIEVAAAEVSPAHRAAEHFRKGANLGNYLEAPRTQSWGRSYSLKDLDTIKSEGFDHVRIPIRWNDYAGPAPEFRIEPELYAKADFLVTNALSRGLSVLINIHHFDEFTTDPKGERPKLKALWGQIASHYNSAPEKLAFEILNEPKDAATTEVMSQVYGEVIPIIRQTNPDRTLFVGPGRWNSLDEALKLKLPENDHNLIVTVHCYDPFYFTHQGATWSGPDTATRGIVYPGPPKKPLEPAASVTNRTHVVNWIKRYNTTPAVDNPSGPKAFRPRMEKVRDWAKANHRPIHLGEFGAYQMADRESRVRYYRDMRKACEELGFGWAIWDWSAGFKYWTGMAPVEGMHEALFGK